MSSTDRLNPICDLRCLASVRRDLAQGSISWQYDLWTSRDFWTKAGEMNTSVFGADEVTGLWRLGLLRAEAVHSTGPLEVPGLELIGQEDEKYTYFDGRTLTRRGEGYAGTIDTSPMPKGTNVYFHPFRIYVVHHILRVFRGHGSATQYLYSKTGSQTVASRDAEHLDKWTASAEFASRFEYWNRVAELAIVCEPAAYREVFNSIRWGGRSSYEAAVRSIESHQGALAPLLRELGTARVHEVRSDLCHSAEILDRNKIVHVLVRLLTGQQRLRLRDRFGLAMHFLTMAEMIRRAAERVFERDLPEEDELGFGHWMEGARRQLYGTERIANPTEAALREFLTVIGIPSGVRARVYVEGDTEVGALSAALGASQAIDVVNLRGQVVERGGKGLSFVDSIQRDRHLGIYSFVILDRDRDEYVRPLKKAAAEDVFFGSFLLSEPDFEYSNFSPEEIAEIVLSLLRDADAPVPEGLLAQLRRANNARELFSVLSDHHLGHIAKGERWGAALATYALSRQQFAPGRPEEKRRLVEFLETLQRTRVAGYQFSVQRSRTDPSTGRFIDRDPPK